jgi:hypothetical protein
MAEKQRAQAHENTQAAESKPSASAETVKRQDIGPVETAVLATVSIAAMAWKAVTRDGTLAAAFRQGIAELGAALKAFPDSIQVSEPGTLWHPTQGEIASDRQASRHTGSYTSYSSPGRQPWPSEIAQMNRHQAANDHGNGHDNSQDAGHSL